MVRISDVIVPVPNAKPEDQPSRIFGYVDISAIDNSRHEIVQPKQFKGRDAPSRARRPIQPDDVLFSNVRTYLRNIALVPEDLWAQLCSTGFTVLRVGPAIDPRFLFRYVLTDDFIDRVTPQQTGTHYPATSDKVVLAEWVPLPPLAEQKRIVAKVEELLAAVNAARERLARMPAILKRFHQSVLGAACSGGLTEEWRARITVRDTPRTSERTRPGPSRPAQMEAAEEEAAAIPDSWSLVAFGDLVLHSLYGPRFSEGDYRSDGVPTIRTTDITFDGRIVLNSPPRVSIDARSLDRLGLRHGDLLVTRTGATIGKCALYHDRVGPGLPSAYLIRFRLKQDLLVPQFALLSFLSPDGQRDLAGGSTATAQPNVNAKAVARVAFPLPPLDEQREIVRCVETLFRLADAIEKRVAAATVRADKLTQAILAKAFCGELVPTEAELARREGRDYEPAQVLLERILAERAHPRNGGSLPHRGRRREKRAES